MARDNELHALVNQSRREISLPFVKKTEADWAIREWTAPICSDDFKRQFVSIELPARKTQTKPLQVKIRVCADLGETEIVYEDQIDIVTGWRNEWKNFDIGIRLTAPIASPNEYRAQTKLDFAVADFEVLEPFEMVLNTPQSEEWKKTLSDAYRSVLKNDELEKWLKYVAARNATEIASLDLDSGSFRWATPSFMYIPSDVPSLAFWVNMGEKLYFLPSPDQLKHTQYRIRGARALIEYTPYKIVLSVKLDAHS